MANNLYGSGFIEKLVNSGYKSPIYAMAEIIDNSVDARAKNIDITFVEDQKREAGRESRFISDVFFIDNGSGMNYEQINGCLRFSEGAGKSNNRIGTFGVGLPNSSIYVGRRVEVYSLDKITGEWNFVCLDLDEQETRVEPGYDEAINKSPNFKNIKVNLDNASTIIRWSKIKNLGSKRPKTIIKKSKMLTGRIYRYALQNDLKITFGSILKGNYEYDILPEDVIPYDPLFVSNKKTYITEHVWKAATKNEKVNPNIPNDEKFTEKFHYKKFIKDCVENETIVPIFQKFDEFWNLKQSITLGGKTYSYKIRASYAYKSIAFPGIGKGGGTDLGREIGYKMSGTRDFASANIFFIRTNREIDFGHYGLYTITDETNRWWTIEVEFEPELDKLMGVDYQKQHVDFRAVNDEDIEDDFSTDVNLGINEQRELLFRDMTTTLKNCIRALRKFRTEYQRQFKLEQNDALANIDQNKNTSPIPTAEPAVIKVMPQGNKWTEAQKTDMTKFLKRKYMSLSEETIATQVDNYAKGLNKTIVIYDDIDSGDLFELATVRNKMVTIINTEHVYYKKIIEPLKQKNQLNIFTVAIEMLMCSYAYEMEKILKDDENNDKLEQILNNLLRKISDRLSSFIINGEIEVDTEYWEEKVAEEDSEIVY